MMYAAWEIFYAKYPTAPKRLFKNRTFIMGIIINWIYMVAGYMVRSLACQAVHLCSVKC